MAAPESAKDKRLERINRNKRSRRPKAAARRLRLYPVELVEGETVAEISTDPSR